MSITTYKTIGVMSGTSLDGLDIAYCVFSNIDGAWFFEIKVAETIPYPALLYDKLNNCTKFSNLELDSLDVELGRWMGVKINQFIEKHELEIDLIASHGHTVFHQPENGLTLQIGSGQEILNTCNILVINDFRSKDVALGGQGAPLVPIGDLLLFSEYQACLNLGGIANISYEINANRIAYDIVAVNIILNELAQRLGKPFDDRGFFAKNGKIDVPLLAQLNNLSFYKKNPPKSLGYEWVEANILSIINASNISDNDKLSTYVEHVATQLVGHFPIGKTLITGGGAYHDYLIERLCALSNKNKRLVIPEKVIVEFKEALIFAFLGVLRIRNDINCLKSVTGASEDCSAGVIYSK